MAKAAQSVKKIVKNIPFSEKIKMTSGADLWNLYYPETAKKLKVRTCDGPFGLRKEVDGNTLSSTCYPTPSALACSFDKKLLQEVGASYGYEAKSEDVDLILGPGINIKRSPICGRNFEYYSEDPVLSGLLSSRFVKGIESSGTGSCIKHFILNNQEYFRYSVSANVDKKALNEIYLKNFMIAVKEGKPYAIMTSYNRINHIYTNEDKNLLDLPRKSWGFSGIYLSDWWATSSREKSFEAGSDVEMPHSESYKRIFPSSTSNAFSSLILEESVKRIVSLGLKFKHNKKEEFSRERSHNLAKYALANSTVLLKNEDNILPILKDEKIAVIGLLAENPYFEGDGSARVNPYKVDNLNTELEKLNLKITYSPGYDENMNTNDSLISDATKKAQESKKVILIIGNKPFFEGEGRDRENMKLPYAMEVLVNKISEINPNLIVIVETGSPVEIPYIDKIKGLLLPYLGGEAVNGGLALNLSGLVSPSGRLSETWPIKMEDHPSMHSYMSDYKDQYYTESIYVGYRYFEKKKMDVLFPFGFGLSYSSFKLSHFHIHKSGKKIVGSVIVKNNGGYDAFCPVLLYSHKENSLTYRAERELVDFEKEFIQKRKSKKISFSFPLEYLYAFDYKQDKMCLEKGKYIFSIGDSSNNCVLKKTLNFGNGIVFEDISYIAKEYYELPKDSFSIASFEKMYGMKMIDEKEKEVGWESNITSFEISENGKKIKSAIYKKLEKICKGDYEKERYYRYMLENQPLRISTLFIPLYKERESYEVIFDIVNGKDKKYADFMNLELK